jgi:hypothetical protein
MPPRRFYIKFSGSAWDVPAETPEEAVEYVRKSGYENYATTSALEIGVDVDELGWPIEKQEPGKP